MGAGAFPAASHHFLVYPRHTTPFELPPALAKYLGAGAVPGVTLRLHDHDLARITRVLLHKEPHARTADKGLTPHPAMNQLGNILPGFTGMPNAEDGTVVPCRNST